MTGFIQGFAHPLAGWDHVLAMLAVGCWAVRMGGRWLPALPLAFVTAMTAGAGLGIVLPLLPGTEVVIGFSVLILCVLVVTGWRFPGGAALGLIGLFALFHGHAHGAEVPAAAGAIGYLSGAVIATALLHAAGASIAYMATSMPCRTRRRASRMTRANRTPR